MMRQWLQRSSLAGLALACAAALAPARAQVFSSGPDDPSLFTTVINLPPDPDIGGSDAIGGIVGETTQLNVSDGGSVGGSFNANSGSEVNISGGSVGHFFRAALGSDVELIGGEFRLNGSDYLGSSISLNVGDVFTGTLADGSAFIFSDSRDTLDVVTLAVPPTPLAPADLTPRVVSTAVVGGPSGLRAGQTLTVQDGGSLGDNFAAVGATLHVKGGSVVNISGGSLGGYLRAYSGSEINLFGTEFLLGGEPITGLTLGEAYTVSDRGVTISGVLGDGSAFGFSGFTGGRGGSYTFSPDATLTVTLVHGPALPGDYDGDGFVSQADLDLVLLNWGVGTLPDGFDTAALGGGGVFDGLLSQNELDGVLLNWGNGTPPAGGLSAIPEPGTLALIALSAAGLLRRSRALG